MLILHYSIGAPFCPSNVAENMFNNEKRVNTVGPEPELIRTDKDGGVCVRITVITCVSSFPGAGERCSRLQPLHMFMESEVYALHVTKGGNETSSRLSPYAARSAALISHLLCITKSPLPT